MGRGQNQHHLATLHLGFGFDGADISHFAGNTHQQLLSQILVNDFSSSETEQDFHLVSALEEAHDLSSLNLEVMLTDFRPHFDFSQLGAFRGLGLFLLFVALITPLTVVKNLTHRGNRIGGNLNQV